MNTFLQDLRYALRRLGKTPGFSIIAIATLALGIGANTAIFTVIDAVLLRPPAYRDPGRLVLLAEHWPTFPYFSVSYLNYLDWRDQNHSFSNVGAVRTTGMTLTGAGDPERLVVQNSTAVLFDLLGVRPIRGRAFTSAEDKAGAPGLAMIGYGLWQRRFGGQDSIIGQTITLDNTPYSVVGVLPPGFEVLQQAPDAVLPFEPWAKTLPNDRSWHPGIRPIARLKPGVTLDAARTDMRTIAARLEKQYPVYNTNVGALVDPLQDKLVENIRPALLVILGAVGFVLLIACTNVANLLLARASARQREIAVRSALGASRWRVIRLALTESLVLSLAGAAVGLLLATAAVPALLHLGGSSLPKTADIHLNSKILFFTTLLALLAGVIFGLAPALHMSALDVRSALSQAERGIMGRGIRRLRSALVVSEVMLATLLLIGAGLLIRSFDRLTSIAPGFAVDHILIADLPVSPMGHANSMERMAFFDRILERSRALPGVRSAGASPVLPVSGIASVIHFNIQGHPPKSPNDYVMANYRAVTPAYLQTLGLPLLSGRLLNDDDRENTPAVVVLNATMARTFFPNESALGKHLQLGALPEKSVPWMEVVGIVGDVKQSLSSDAPTEMYVPVRQGNQLLPVFTVSLVLRTSGDPVALSRSLIAAVHEIDPNQPLINLRTMEDIVAASVAQPRFRTVLLASLAILALVIAAVGIYGVMAFSITQRTREIGTRMALGSTPLQVFRLMIREGMVLTMIGATLGLVAAAIVAHSFSSFLFQVSFLDPLTLVMMTALLMMIALLACYVPARRATRVDPTVALRYE